MSKRDNRERGGFLRPDLGDEISEVLSTPEEPPVLVATPVAPAPVEDVPLVTIEVFTRGSGNPVMQAFAKTEKLTHSSATRKLSKAQWKSEYDQFLSTPR